jgi:hypothetical protein
VNFQILNYRGTIEEDREITSLLNHVYVKDGYTDKSYAEKIFVPAELNGVRSCWLDQLLENF